MLAEPGGRALAPLVGGRGRVRISRAEPVGRVPSATWPPLAVPGGRRPRLSQDLAPLPEHGVLAPQAAKLLPLVDGQALPPAAVDLDLAGLGTKRLGAAVVLGDPGNRLARGAHEIDRLAAELRWVRRSGTGHLNSFPSTVVSRLDTTAKLARRRLLWPTRDPGRGLGVEPAGAARLRSRRRQRALEEEVEQRAALLGEQVVHDATLAASVGQAGVAQRAQVVRGEVGRTLEHP